MGDDDRRILGEESSGRPGSTEARQGLQDELDPFQDSSFEPRPRELPRKAQSHSLEQSSWGVICAADDNETVREGLDQLIGHREQQVGKPIPLIVYPDGVSARQFLAEHGDYGGKIDPLSLPYYLLIVSSPAKIPFAVQCTLSIGRAVGRLDFDTIDDLKVYAENVVTVEKGEVDVPRRTTVIDVDNGDGVTDPFRAFWQPFEEILQQDAQGFEAEILKGDQVKTAAIIERLNRRNPSTALLVALSHGQEMPAGDPRQQAMNGAIIGSEWNGSEWNDEETVPDAFCYTGEHVAPDADLRGLVAFLFACHGVGTPAVDSYKRKHPRIAIQPFVAALPKAWMRRGALAVIGHIDTSYSYSVQWPGSEQTSQTTASLADTFRGLYRGDRIGHALRPLADRNKALAAHLAEMEADFRRFGAEVVTQQELLETWIAKQDARNIILLGDPAIRLSGTSSDPVPQSSAQDHNPSKRPQKARPLIALDPLPRFEGHVPTVPDLRLFVEYEYQHQKTTLHFYARMADSKRSLPALNRWCSQTLQGDDEAYINRKFRSIEGAQREHGNFIALRALLDGLGRILFKSLLPPEIQELLWTLTQEWSSESDRLRSILVFSGEEAWIPWHMLQVYDRTHSKSRSVFLAEVCALARWPWKSDSPLQVPDRDLPLERPTQITIRSEDLPAALLENRDLKRLADQYGRRTYSTAPEVSAVLRDMSAATFDAWHFAGHAQGNGDGGQDWSLQLGNNLRLYADQLRSPMAAPFGEQRPFVFLNACHTGHGSKALTSADGLATTFLEIGASAFMGASWQTDDAAAADFARAFYRYFYAGYPLGEAVRLARLEIRQLYLHRGNKHRGDTSWLTYTLYGHPLALCQSLGKSQPLDAEARFVPPPRLEPKSSSWRLWLGGLIGLLVGLISLVMLSQIPVPAKFELTATLQSFEFDLVENSQALLSTLPVTRVGIRQFDRITWTPHQLAPYQQPLASWPENQTIALRAQRPSASLDLRMDVTSPQPIGPIMAVKPPEGNARRDVRIDASRRGPDGDIRLTLHFHPRGNTLSLPLPDRGTMKRVDTVSNVGSMLPRRFDFSTVEPMDRLNLSTTINGPRLKLALLVSKPDLPLSLLGPDSLKVSNVRLIDSNDSGRIDRLLHLSGKIGRRPLEPFSKRPLFAIRGLTRATVEGCDLLITDPEKIAALRCQLIGEAASIQTQDGETTPEVYEVSKLEDLIGEGSPALFWILWPLACGILGTVGGYCYSRAGRVRLAQ